MKKKTIYITLILGMLLTIFAGGCRKWPQNGDLDGMWEIMSIEFSDGRSNVPPKAYYCFQRSICQIRGGRVLTSNMIYEDNRIHLDFPDVQVSLLRPYGIGSNPVTFTILHLSSKKLVISNDYATLTMRKF